MNRSLKTVLTLVAAVALVASASLGALAVVTTLHDQSHSVANDHSGAYVDVTDTEVNGTAENVTATFYGVDNGTETQIDSAKLSATENETATHEISFDPANYDEIRVVVEGERAGSIDSGLIGRTSGGGFSLGGTAYGVPVWLWLVAAAGAFIYSRGD